MTLSGWSSFYGWSRVPKYECQYKRFPRLGRHSRKPLNKRGPRGERGSTYTGSFSISGDTPEVATSSTSVAIKTATTAGIEDTGPKVTTSSVCATGTAIPTSTSTEAVKFGSASQGKKIGMYISRYGGAFMIGLVEWIVVLM
jgi:hypothetical protein